MKIPIAILMLLFYSIASSQQTMYFNKTYSSNANYYSSGYSVLEREGNYIGYGYTNEPTNTDNLFFFEIDSVSEVVSWAPNSEQQYYIKKVGGVMKKSTNGQYYLAYSFGFHLAGLQNIDSELNLQWDHNYCFGDHTFGANCYQTLDKGYVICGTLFYTDNSHAQVLLIKTDSIGNTQWQNSYGDFYEEQGLNIITTPDGGYLIGGYIYNPGPNDFLDALVMKIDSMGDLQWTKYYGNPDVDDDMAFVAMSADDNYLLATTYGEYDVNSDSRAGSIYIAKIDKDDGEIIWDNKIGEARTDRKIKTFKKVEENHYIAAGWSLITDSTIPFNETCSTYAGWILKLDAQAESFWYRDFYHYTEQNDVNNLFDVSPTSDNGFIATGTAHPESENPKLWVVKMDSMLCDTPGCVTVVRNKELFYANDRKVKVWPNPFLESFKVLVQSKNTSCNNYLRVYNSQGIKIEEQVIPASKEIIVMNSRKWEQGLYYIQIENSGKIIGTSKILKK